MILTAHQTAYLPWLGLIHKIALADIYVYMDTVQLEKTGFNNRNKIKSPNGAVMLSVPLFKHGHREKKANEIEIKNDEHWQKDHWNTIKRNYKNAKYFNKYADFFEHIYSKEWQYLTDLNYEMLLWHLDVLNIKTKVYKMSDYDFKGEKSDLIIDMVKKLNCDKYIFGALGKDYAESEKFEKENIKIYFQDYIHPTYSQQFAKKPFEPYMAAIDLIFNEGEKSFDIIMLNNIKKQELI